MRKGRVPRLSQYGVQFWHWYSLGLFIKPKQFRWYRSLQIRHSTIIPDPGSWQQQKTGKFLAARLFFFVRLCFGNKLILCFSKQVMRCRRIECWVYVTVVGVLSFCQRSCKCYGKHSTITSAHLCLYFWAGLLLFVTGLYVKLLQFVGRRLH